MHACRWMAKAACAPWDHWPRSAPFAREPWARSHQAPASINHFKGEHLYQFGSFDTICDFQSFKWTIIELVWVSLMFIEFHPFWLSFIIFHGISYSFIVFHLFSSFFIGFHRFPLRFIEFQCFSLSFIVSHWVPLCFIEFHWVSSFFM